MAERELWFRARHPERGTGYGLAHWKGAAVVGFYAGVVTVGAVAPPLMFGANWATIAVAVAVVLGSTAALLQVIRTHSDWNG